MKIVVCGAGQVGGQIIRYLSRLDCEVTVIDKNPNLVRQATDRMDVEGITGFASHPSVLLRAGVTHASTLIAATSEDEVNILSCSLAKSMGSKALTIARIREQQYCEFLRDHPDRHVDHVISPEIQVAESALRLIEFPSVSDKRDLLDGAAYFVAMQLDRDCPMIRTPLRQLSELFESLICVVVGYRRDQILYSAKPQDELFEGDEVLIVVARDDLRRALHLFEKEMEPCRHVIVVGSGHVGLQVAKRLDRLRIRAKIIERDKARAELTADELFRTVVLHGDGLDNDILQEASIGTADAIFALTQDDRTNLLVATRAKHAAGGRPTAVSLVNDPSLEALKPQLGIDAVLNPRAVTVSSILPHVRTSGSGAIHSVGDAEAEVIEAVITRGMRIEGKTVVDANLPEEALIGAISKNGRLVRVMPSTRIEAGDSLAIFSLTRDVGRVLSLLGTDDAPN